MVSNPIIKIVIPPLMNLEGRDSKGNVARIPKNLTGKDESELKNSCFLNSSGLYYT